jgi:hypothetical protein
MNELDQEPLEQAIEKIDMVAFDTTHFKTILQDTSLQFMLYKIFSFNNFCSIYHIELSTLVNFGKEI